MEPRVLHVDRFWKMVNCQQEAGVELVWFALQMTQDSTNVLPAGA